MSVRESLHNRENWKQFLRFGVVGGSGVLVNMLVAVIMTKAHGGDSHDLDVLFDIPGTAYAFRWTVLVWIVGFLVANLTNFQLNRSWTFGGVRHRSWWREFWPFFGIGAAAAFVGAFIKIALTNPTSPIYLPDPPFNGASGLQSRSYWAQAITIVITTPINFIFNKLFTFAAVQGRRGDSDDVDVPLVAPVVAPELVDDTGEIRALSDDEIAERDRARAAGDLGHPQTATSRRAGGASAATPTHPEA